MPAMIEIKLSADELEGTEATLSQWLINTGDLIQQGEPIVELETDKVSMEICAPKTGILKQILIQSGEQVETGLVLATLSEQTISEIKNDSNHSETLLSPSVRRLLKENNLEVNAIKIDGSGKDGRITRNDLMLYLANTDAVHTTTEVEPCENHPIKEQKTTLIPHSNIRKSIAKNMVNSLLKISPHVTSVFEMDMSKIIEHRTLYKHEFTAKGVHLTFTAYFLAAIVKAIQQVPEVNARFHQHALELFCDINIGVGTALGNEGIVVPVVHQVQTMDLYQIAKALTIQTAKARNASLKTADMKGGTFTLSNHGVSGSLFAAPIIIRQPEIAILGIGKLQKRVIVEEINGRDAIMIKPLCYVSLSIDHRALDAYQTNQFLTTFVKTIENWHQPSGITE